LVPSVAKTADEVNTVGNNPASAADTVEGGKEKLSFCVVASKAVCVTRPVCDVCSNVSVSVSQFQVHDDVEKGTVPLSVTNAQPVPYLPASAFVSGGANAEEQANMATKAKTVDLIMVAMAMYDGEWMSGFVSKCVNYFLWGVSCVRLIFTPPRSVTKSFCYLLFHSSSEHWDAC
jgi:hypothetical protein